MSTNVVSPGWFGIAVHAAVLLARSGDVCSSASMACSLHSHAAFLRRVLAQVVRAGIVEAREGRDGGYRLARPADPITLAEIYRAVKSSGPDPLSPPEPPADGPFALGLRAALDELTDEAEARIVAFLEGYTIASIEQRALALAEMEPTTA